jgi:hypothetical protein
MGGASAGVLAGNPGLRARGDQEPSGLEGFTPFTPAGSTGASALLRAGLLRSRAAGQAPAEAGAYWDGSWIAL